MFDGLSGHYAGGIYHAEWDGTGVLEWSGDAVVTQTGITATGRHYALLNVTPGNAGIQMRLASTSTSDPIRNINVWMPDYNGQSFVGQVWQPGANFSPFHPLYLERLAGFSTVRFMQMSETVTSDIVQWADRKPWNYETQVTDFETFQNGVAPEYEIELANELHADAWFTMPHMANDDYVHHFATQVRDTLNPSQKAYVEWSNEAWNSAPGFETYQWIQQQLALPANAGLDFYQILGREASRDFGIWSEVYAGQTDRMVRVAAGFEASSWVTGHLLADMGGNFDAVSVAAYFGPSMSFQQTHYAAGVTTDQILTDTQASIPQMITMLQQNQALADQYAASLGHPIQFLAYEGGPSLMPANPANAQAFYDAGVDPRMYNIFTDALNQLNQSGLDLFMNFQYINWGRASQLGDFGALHYQDQPTAEAPKYHALLDYLAATTPPPPPPPPAGILLQPTTPLLTSEAGGTAQFTVTLTSRPAGVVTIALFSSDLTEGVVSIPSLTFTPTNWMTAQSVTVTGVNDYVNDGNVAYAVRASVTSADPNYSGLVVPEVTLSNRDNDVAVGQTFSDADGDVVTVSLKGAGSITTLTYEDNGNGHRPLQIILANTNATSTLTIKVKKSRSGDGFSEIGMIQADAALKSIAAASTDLVGALAVNGNVTSLALHSLLNAEINVTGILSSLNLSGSMSESAVTAQALKKILVSGTVSPDCSFTATQFPASAKINGVTVHPLTDPRFVLLP